MKIYLAGPDVFLPDAAAAGRLKKEVCARFGLEGLFPLDNEITGESGPELSLRIFRSNLAMMEEADAVIANLTPFRGPSADPGTVFELGYMAGRGKYCVGYSNVIDTYLDRALTLSTIRREGERYVDDQGWTVEDFSLPDNLMIIHALNEFGHPLVVPRDPPSDLGRDLSAFEHCVRLVAERNASLAKTSVR